MKIGKVFLAALLCVWPGCVSKPKANELLALATQYARRAGYDVEKYDAELDAKDYREVCVMFVGKERRPGNHFMILINSKTRTCRIVEGR